MLAPAIAYEAILYPEGRECTNVEIFPTASWNGSSPEKQEYAIVAAMAVPAARKAVVFSALYVGLSLSGRSIVTAALERLFGIGVLGPVKGLDNTLLAQEGLDATVEIAGSTINLIFIFSCIMRAIGESCLALLYIYR